MKSLSNRTWGAVIVVAVLFAAVFAAWQPYIAPLVIPLISTPTPVPATGAVVAEWVEENTWLAIYGWETAPPTEDGEYGAILVWYIEGNERMFNASGLTQEEALHQSGLALATMIGAGIIEDAEAVAIVFVDKRPGEPVEIVGLAYLLLNEFQEWKAEQETVTAEQILQYVSERYEDLAGAGMAFTPLTEDFVLYDGG